MVENTNICSTFHYVPPPLDRMKTAIYHSTYTGNATGRESRKSTATAREENTNMTVGRILPQSCHVPVSSTMLLQGGAPMVAGREGTKEAPIMELASGKRLYRLK